MIVITIIIIIMMIRLNYDMIKISDDQVLDLM